MRITKANWAKSVNAAMPIPREIKKVKSLNPRNAYQMKLEREYNSGTSVRHLSEVKMYAGLARKKKCKKLGIKSLNDNKTISQSDNSWWQANVDSSSTVVSMSALQTQFTAASIGADSPTVGFCTRSIYDLYYNLLQPQQRSEFEEAA